MKSLFGRHTFDSEISKLFRQADHLSVASKDDVCVFNTFNGFHRSDPIYMIKDVFSIHACALLCIEISVCLSGNFIANDNTKSGLCTLHSSDAEGHLDQIVVEQSMYFEFKCKGKPFITTTLVNKMPPPKQCGLIMGGDLGPNTINVRRKRIVRGFTAPPYSRPWHGWLLHKNIFNCGISLVAQESKDTPTIWALTAAHCFTTDRRASIARNDYKFIFGGQDHRLSTPYMVVRHAKRIYWHPTFNFTSTAAMDEGDFALVELTEPVPISTYVLPICLPDLIANPDVWLSSAVCHVCGHGFMKDRFPLEVGKGTITPNRLRCAETLSTQRSHRYQFLFEFSTDLLYRGPSSGDSGGGHECRYSLNDRAVLMGVINGRIIRSKITYYIPRVSYFTYDAYVPYYLDWITNHLERKDDDLEASSSCYPCLS